MMKRHSLLSLVLMLTLPFISLPTYAAETFTLDPNHTVVVWHINHLGFSTQMGKFFANGTVVLDKETPANSKVNAVIKISDGRTGIPVLDKHLKEEMFFYTKKYPTATFVSTKVDVTSDTTATVQGDLTLRGVTKPVTMMVTLNKAGTNPISNKSAVGFSATADIKRSDFGINGYTGALGDDVRLNIEAEAQGK
jgi:polyisoprenoid-binding protein YceI